MRQFARSIVLPNSLAEVSPKFHCVGSAINPSSEYDATDSTPAPYLPATFIPDGERNFLLQRTNLQRRVVQLEPRPGVTERFIGVEQPQDDAEAFVHPVAL